MPDVSSDVSVVEDALAAELEWAEEHLKVTHRKHEALQQKLDMLKPDIREVTTHPVADEQEDRDPLDVLADQYMQYRQKAIAAERLRHQILQIRVQRSSVTKSVSGPAGALSFDLDFLGDHLELLNCAERLTLEFEKHRRTVWKVFYETLEQINALVISCRDEYIRKSLSLHEQISELRADGTTHR
jgi:hypothetical protein